MALGPATIVGQVRVGRSCGGGTGLRRVVLGMCGTKAHVSGEYPEGNCSCRSESLCMRLESCDHCVSSSFTFPVQACHPLESPQQVVSTLTLSCLGGGASLEISVASCDLQCMSGEGREVAESSPRWPGRWETKRKGNVCLHASTT